MLTYKPTEEEREKASNCYLMSLLSIIIGLPLPIINLIAALIFYLANRKSTYFVRWHCIQSLLSQITIFLINSYTFWNTFNIVFGEKEINNDYIALVIVAILVNIFELITNIVSALKVKKGKHIEWWFFSSLTDLLCTT